MSHVACRMSHVQMNRTAVKRASPASDDDASDRKVFLDLAHAYLCLPYEISHMLRSACCMSHVACRMLDAECQVSPTACCMPHITCYMPHIKPAAWCRTRYVLAEVQERRSIRRSTGDATCAAPGGTLHVRMFACSHVRNATFSMSHVACSHVRMFACRMFACSHVRMSHVAYFF